MPKSGFQETRCTIDCTELFIQQPSPKVMLQTVLFQQKNITQQNSLVTIARPGPITWAWYIRRFCDRLWYYKWLWVIQIYFLPNDHIMTERGFEIQRLLDEIGVRVDHLLFYGCYTNVYSTKLHVWEFILNGQLRGYKISRFHLNHFHTPNGGCWMISGRYVQLNSNHLSFVTANILSAALTRESD